MTVTQGSSRRRASRTRCRVRRANASGRTVVQQHPRAVREAVPEARTPDEPFHRVLLAERIERRFLSLLRRFERRHRIEARCRAELVAGFVPFAELAYP